MTKVERRIAITYFIMFAISLVINGIYNYLFVTNQKLLFLEIIAVSMISALFYLFFIFIFTRRRVMLSLFTTVVIGTILLLILLPIHSNIESSSHYTWVNVIYHIVTSIYSVVALVLGKSDASKLRDETLSSIKMGNISITVTSHDEDEGTENE